MAANGRSITLTASQIRKLNKLRQVRAFTNHLADKGISYQSLRNPLLTGRVSEKLYTRLKDAKVI